MVMSSCAAAIISSDVADRMADLQLQVPQYIEQRLDHLLAPWASRSGAEEHQVQVAVGRHLAAPGAAQPDDRHALARRGVGDRIERWTTRS